MGYLIPSRFAYESLNKHATALSVHSAEYVEVCERAEVRLMELSEDVNASI